MYSSSLGLPSHEDKEQCIDTLVFDHLRTLRNALKD